MQDKLPHQLIWNHVKSLLYKHDCVIMPNFGGFVCNLEHARIDQVSHVISPPAKRVMFNQNLKINDGLLAQHIAQEAGVTYSEALLAIEELVNGLKNRLEIQKQLEVEQFGTFRLNAEANYVFLPNKLNNYLNSSYGLTPLQATPVTEMAHGSRKTRVFKDRKEIKQARNVKSKRGLVIRVLSLLIIGLVGINAYIILTQNNLINPAQISSTGIHSWFDSLIAQEHHTELKQPDLKPTKAQTENVTTQTATDSNEAVVANEAPATKELDNINPQHWALHFENVQKYVPVGTTEENVAPTTEVIEPTSGTENTTPIEEPTNAVKSEQLVYHVIGGVFCNEANARTFYNKLKAQGFEAELLLNKKINCNRVSYRKCGSYDEAASLIDSLSAGHQSDIWILAVKE